MLLLQTILKNTYIFLKKKYIIIYFIMWLKILKRNYSLIKIINVIKFNNYIVTLLLAIILSGLLVGTAFSSSSSESVGGLNVTLSPNSGTSGSTVNMNFTLNISFG